MSKKNTHRTRRADIAAETIKIVDQKYYINNLGQSIDLRTDLEEALGGALWYQPEALEKIEAQLSPDFEKKETTFEVLNCTTLAAAKSLLEAGEKKVLALNFASAKNPGGGFLGGSQAQEECLARASALYETQVKYMEMYLNNRKWKSCLYTNNMIYSPNVPVIRDDEDALLDTPYKLSFITAAAVNAGCIRKNEPKNAKKIAPFMLDRIAKVLSIAAHHDYETLVLGAWGCGVFQNEPQDIAAQFKEQLCGHPLFKNRFKKVVFGVLDFSKNEYTFKAFKRTF